MREGRTAVDLMNFSRTPSVLLTRRALVRLVVSTVDRAVGRLIGRAREEERRGRAKDDLRADQTLL